MPGNPHAGAASIMCSNRDDLVRACIQPISYQSEPQRFFPTIKEAAPRKCLRTVEPALIMHLRQAAASYSGCRRSHPHCRAYRYGRSGRSRNQLSGFWIDPPYWRCRTLRTITWQQLSPMFAPFGNVAKSLVAVRVPLGARLNQQFVLDSRTAAARAASSI